MNVQIWADSANLGSLSLADVQRLLQGIHGALAVAEGGMIFEWNPRDDEHPLRVTTVTRDKSLFRKDAV